MSVCWFCGKPYPPDQPGDFNVDMYKITGVSAQRNTKVISYDWKKLTVPACRTCGWKVRLTTAAETLIGAIGTFFIVFILVRNINLAVAIVFGGACAVFAALYLVESKSRGLPDRMMEYPPLKELSDTGWKFGKSPRRLIGLS